MANDPKINAQYKKVLFDLTAQITLTLLSREDVKIDDDDIASVAAKHASNIIEVIEHSSPPDRPSTGQH